MTKINEFNGGVAETSLEGGMVNHGGKPDGEGGFTDAFWTHDTFKAWLAEQLEIPDEGFDALDAHMDANQITELATGDLFLVARPGGATPAEKYKAITGENLAAEVGAGGAGANYTPLDLETLTGTVTLATPTRPFQYGLNDGAFTLEPQAAYGTIELEVRNGASAGAINVSAYGDNVFGDTYATTENLYHIFKSTRHQNSVRLDVQAMVEEYVPPAAEFWDYTDEASLGAYYDASDFTTITDAGAGKVSVLQDKSANAHHLVQSTDTRRPITGTRTVNSLNVLDFAGGTTSIGLSSFPWASVSGDVLINMVFAADDVPTERTLFRMGNPDRIAPAAHNSAGGTFYMNIFGTGNENGGFVGAIVDGVQTIFTIVLDATADEYRLYQDGVLIHTQAGGYETIIDAGELHLFDAANGAGHGQDGVLCEWSCFSDISDTLRQKVEGKSAAQWNIALPSGHPYEFGPPEAE